MSEPHNRILRVGRYGGPDGLDVVDAPMPEPGAGEVRVRVLACGVEYTDVVIRRSGSRDAHPQLDDGVPAPAPRGARTAGLDGIGEDGWRRSRAALRPGGLLCAYGYSAAVQAGRPMAAILASIARLYLWRWRPGGVRGRFYSINAMRAQHPAWFKEDLARLFALLAAGTIRPRVAERISVDAMAEAHRPVEAGGLDGKLVLCP